MFAKRQVSRRERALAKLSGIDPKNTIVRRSIARVIFYFALWIGVLVGTIGTSIIGILLMVGPKLLEDVWNQKDAEPRRLPFGLFAILVGGSVGIFCALSSVVYLIRRSGLLSDDTIDKIF